MQHLDSLSKIHKKTRDTTMMTQQIYAISNLVIILKSSVSLITAVHAILDSHFINASRPKFVIDHIKPISSILTNAIYIIGVTLICASTARKVIFLL